MIIMVDSNEATDRDKNHRDWRGNPDRHKRVDPSNIRVLKRLRQRFPDVQSAPLTCGDINIILDNGDLIAIERKRAGDFLGSIRDGHIQKQVQRMAENAKWSAVVIEGLITFDTDDMAEIPVFDKDDNIYAREVTGWHGEAVRSVMYAIQFNGTPVVTIQYPQQLPDVVESFVRFCSKPAEHMQGMGRRRVVTFPPLTLQEDLFSQFPGIGPKLTKSLVKFAYQQNEEINGAGEENTPVLAEMLCWGSYLGKINYKSRPEGWGDIKIQNFRTALGLGEGKYLTIEEDREEIEAKRKLAMKAKAGKTKQVQKPSKNERSKNGRKR